MNSTQNEIVAERLRHIEIERKMQDEVNKIREQQIADLVAILMSNKSDLDPEQIGLIMSQQPVSKELQDKIDDRMAKFKAEKEQESQAIKRTRFEDQNDFARVNYSDRSPGSEEKVPETKGISMFDKVPIQRTKLITPRNKVEKDAKFNTKRKTLESSDSIPYSDNFEPDESAAISRSKSALRVSKDDIQEEIPEDIDDIKDTITEKIDEEYSNNFEEISESIVQSKKLPSKSKFKDSNNRLNSRYSASRIDEEDSIQEDIEESLPVRIKGHDEIGEHSSSSYRNTAKIKSNDPKIVSRPDGSLHKSKSKEKFPQNKLIEKLQENNINDFIKTISKGIEASFKEEQNKLVQEYSDSIIDDHEYARKKLLLEQWRDKEMNDVKKKKMLIEGWVQMSEIVAKIKTDDDSIGHSSGSIKDLRKAPKYLFNKPFSNYEKQQKNDQDEQNSSNSQLGVDDDSDDSFGIRRAKKQIRDIRAHEDLNDSAEEDILDEADIKMRKKNTKKKRLAAKQLLEEKEKAIQEGLKQKMVELDEKHAQTMLNEALKIDVKKEIEKRFEIMLEFDEEQKVRRDKFERDRQKQLEDSIGESSLNFNKSVNSNIDSAISKSTSLKENTRPKKIIGRNVNDRPKSVRTEDGGVKEDTIRESIEYSNDFNSNSQATLKIDTKPENNDSKVPDQIKEQSNIEKSEIPSEISEDYSENFDESNDASSQLGKSIKSLSKDRKSAKIISDQIQEATGEDEGESTPRIQDNVDDKSRNPSKQQVPNSKSDSIVDETPVDSDEQEKEEFVRRVPTDKIDEYININKMVESTSSNDFEVLEGSHQSVDWVIDVPSAKHEDEKLKTINEDSKDSKEEKQADKKVTDENDDISEDYSFDDFDAEDSKNSNQDVETPRVSDKTEEDDIMNDKDKVADLIAEELFNAIDEIGLFDKMKSKILPERDFTEDDFKDKFPFKKPIEPKVEKKMPLKSQVEFFDQLADEIMQPRN